MNKVALGFLGFLLLVSPVVPLTSYAADAEFDEPPTEQAPENENDHLRLVPFYGNREDSTLEKKEKNGTYVYRVTPSPQNYSGGIRAGPITPTQLKGDVAGVTFQNVYGASKPVLISFDLEYQFFQKAGKLGAKAGFGFFSASGNGRFQSNPGGVQADEAFTLYVFPLNVSAVYHLQFWDTQVLVPFAEAGGDYFGMLETRSDKTGFQNMIKYGAVPGFHWAAGAQFQLDFLDKEVLWQLDQEYGINHIYLTVDMRQIFGLNTTYDFSSTYFEGGFLFEF